MSDQRSDGKPKTLASPGTSPADANSDLKNAKVVVCDLEDDPHRGKQLVAWVKVGPQLVKYRIESSRSWTPIQGRLATPDQQRRADEVLWAYLRDFTGEIDAKLMTHLRASG